MAKATRKKASKTAAEPASRTAAAKRKARGEKTKSAAKPRSQKRSASATPAKSAKRTPAARRRTATGPARKAGSTREASRRTASRAKAKPVTRSIERKKNAARATALRQAAAAAPAASRSTLGSAATVIRGAVAGAMAAVTQKLPWTSDQLDALQMLEQDHRRFEDLLRQGEESTERAVTARSELLDTLTRELNEHELKEEKFLYPLLQAHPEAKEIVLEGYQEHHVADVIVRELHGVATDDEQWGAKFKVLKENIEHHIQEEEGEMFRVARAAIPREELLALGQRMGKAVAGR